MAWLSILGFLWTIFGDKIKELFHRLFSEAAAELPEPHTFGSEAEATLALIDKVREKVKGPFQRLVINFMRRHAVREGKLVKHLEPEVMAQLSATVSKEEEVINGIQKLVESQYSGDYRKAFDAYDSNKDGTLSSDELTGVLVDADIGSRFSRWLYVRGIIKELDMLNTNGSIEWEEFIARVKG